MKASKTNLTLLLIACGSILFSCKKDKSNDQSSGCSVTVANLAGTYKLTALQYKLTASSQPIDYLTTMDACEKDDILTLKNNGTYVHTDAGIVCSPSESNEGTWSLKDKTLTSDGILNGTVANFDCKTLTYYVENTLKSGDKMTFTLEKQ
jgi:hypothetical protein